MQTTEKPQSKWAFVNEHLSKDETIWNKVTSDESKFHLFGSDGRKIVLRKANTVLDFRDIIPTVKYGDGGSVMVWGCFSAAVVGKLAFVDSIMET
jgi:hypothetical protein